MYWIYLVTEADELLLFFQLLRESSVNRGDNDMEICWNVNKKKERMEINRNLVKMAWNRRGRKIERIPDD